MTTLSFFTARSLEAAFQEHKNGSLRASQSPTQEAEQHLQLVKASCRAAPCKGRKSSLYCLRTRVAECRQEGKLLWPSLETAYNTCLRPQMTVCVRRGLQTVAGAESAAQLTCSFLQNTQHQRLHRTLLATGLSQVGGTHLSFSGNSKLETKSVALFTNKLLGHQQFRAPVFNRLCLKRLPNETTTGLSITMVPTSAEGGQPSFCWHNSALSGWLPRTAYFTAALLVTFR